MQPMLATRGDRVPEGADWLHEVKWDGMRVLVEVHDGVVRAFSRNENDVTVSFPELLGLGELGLEVVLDGEVVALRSDARAQRDPGRGAGPDQPGDAGGLRRPPPWR